jgi:hypothetical protein
MAKEEKDKRRRNLGPNRSGSSDTAAPKAAKSVEEIERLAQKIDEKAGLPYQMKSPTSVAPHTSVSLRVPSQLMEKITEEIQRSGKSRTHIILDALWQYYDSKE